MLNFLVRRQHKIVTDLIAITSQHIMSGNGGMYNYVSPLASLAGNCCSALPHPYYLNNRLVPTMARTFKMPYTNDAFVGTFNPCR